MSGVNRALARIKKSGKRYDWGNSEKSIGNDISNKVDHVSCDGRQSIKHECGSIIPVTPELGWDRKKKPKIHESGEQGGILSNPGGSYSNKSCLKKIQLQKEMKSCGNVLPTIDGLISPTKALRVAQLKKRFGDLISKATHQLAVMPPQGDPMKLQQEKERIAEKAKIEKQIKVSETLLRIRAEAESKMQRQREREASRIALEKMERTVEFNDAMQTMRDFESLLGCIC